MNHQEFKDWLDYHLTVYPSVRTWLNNQSGTENMAFILSEWESVLQNCSEGSCAAVSRDMLSGTIDRPFPEDTASKVRIWASHRDAENAEKARKIWNKSFTKQEDTQETAEYASETARWHDLPDADRDRIRIAVFAKNEFAAIHYRRNPESFLVESLFLKEMGEKL